MKISKSLLQAILVGVTLGTTTSSCSMLDAVTGTDENVCEESCKVDHEHKRTASGGDWHDHDCPGCGLG